MAGPGATRRRAVPARNAAHSNGRRRGAVKEAGGLRRAGGRFRQKPPFKKARGPLLLRQPERAMREHASRRPARGSALCSVQRSAARRGPTCAAGGQPRRRLFLPPYLSLSRAAGTQRQRGRQAAGESGQERPTFAPGGRAGARRQQKPAVEAAPGDRPTPRRFPSANACTEGVPMHTGQPNGMNPTAGSPTPGARQGRSLKKSGPALAGRKRGQIAHCSWRRRRGRGRRRGSPGGRSAGCPAGVLPPPPRRGRPLGHECPGVRPAPGRAGMAPSPLVRRPGRDLHGIDDLRKFTHCRPNHPAWPARPS